MKKILVVDDDYAFSSYARRLLEDQGLEVFIAATGAAGLLQAAQERPHLILLDLGLPDMDGFAVLKAVQSKPETRRIPVVICSIVRREKETREALALGAADFLEKPLSPLTSIPRLKEIISAHEQKGSA